MANLVLGAPPLAVPLAWPNKLTLETGAPAIVEEM